MTNSIQPNNQTRYSSPITTFRVTQDDINRVMQTINRANDEIIVPSRILHAANRALQDLPTINQSPEQ